MAEAVVSFALQHIDNLLAQERLLSGVPADVEELEKKLKEMKCLIEDTHRRRHESKTVANWIEQIIDLTYRAEAAIETFEARVSSKRREKRMKKRLHRYACIFREYHSLYHLHSEISNITFRLESVTDQLNRYGIRKLIESSATRDEQRWRKTFPEFEIGDCFVGMEVELNKLVSLLVDDKKPRVVSIWGMGGVGKTTIAKKVYNEMKNTGRKYFDLLAWVCITQKCESRSVFEELVKQLERPEKISNATSLQKMAKMGEGMSYLNENELIERLREIQRAKRCLIVLDDLWRTSQWNEIKHPFVLEGLQSKIVVTTRRQDVADNVGFSLQLGLLNEDHALKLLKKKAFPENNIPDSLIENLNEIGKEMVQKCGYLPLAISVLGAVLSKKDPSTEWEKVNKNINEYIFRADGQDEKENQIQGVLSLSYDDLPYYLKPCFLYLGTLREDESINVEELYALWIAQGMISSEKLHGNKETLVEIAQSYLSELSSRSIIQVEVDNLDPTKKYTTCKLHDVVREVCLSIGRNENFGVQTLTYEGGSYITSLREKTRYLVIYYKGEALKDGEDLTIHSKEDTIKHIRSLHIVRDESCKIMQFPPQREVGFKSYRMLRDLVIAGFKFPKRKLPKGITSLIHLRCLRLQYCELDELPSSIKKLVYLETLDLSYTLNIRVPNVLKKMSRLKHLILPPYFGDTIGNYQLSFDEGLDELETLTGFDSRVHDLKSTTIMKSLRHLSASVYDAESLAILIEATSMSWNKLGNCEVIIEEGGLMILEQVLTCPNLNYLVINVKIGMLLPECTNNMNRSKLVALTLRDCDIEDDSIKVLGMLPCLRHLYLTWDSFVGEELTCPASSFPRLVTLRLLGLPRLRRWRMEKGAMPILTRLDIGECPFLETVPEELRGISTLKKIFVLGMPELGKRVGPSGEDFHKVCHVPSIMIEDS